jgi:hypothetical protein
VSKRSLVGVLALVVVGLVGGCSTPRTASGTLDQGKVRVVQLVLDVAHAMPPTVQYQPPTEVGTQPCRKTVAGYVTGTTGAHRAEVPLILHTPASEPATALLARIERLWTAAGYELDRSRVHESSFPQIRAHAPDGYDIVATAFAKTAKVPSQIDLYSVSQCLRGS